MPAPRVIDMLLQQPQAIRQWLTAHRGRLRSFRYRTTLQPSGGRSARPTLLATGLPHTCRKGGAAHGGGCVLGALRGAGASTLVRSMACYCPVDIQAMQRCGNLWGLQSAGCSAVATPAPASE
jgi:hypothetical protein